MIIKTRLGTLNSEAGGGVLTRIKTTDGILPADDNGVVTIPNAGLNQLGLIKTVNQNNIEIKDGILTRINVNALYQKQGDYAILHSGSANTFSSNHDIDNDFYIEPNN